MAPLTPARVAAQAEMLANRVARRFKHLHPRMERAGVGAFRLYDWDIPEVRAVVDWCEGHLVVGEYARTQTDLVDDWVGAMARATAAALGVDAARVHARPRQPRPREGARPARPGAEAERIIAREAPLRFWVALDDPLETGLPTDRRIARARVLSESAGRRALSLFGSTGGFACAAARGGAAETTTVDASARHLAWAEDNLGLNGLAGPVNATVRDDPMSFAERSVREGRRWDTVILDPPSFLPRSATGDMDLQRDHRWMVEAALRALADGGVLWFSTSHPRFAPQLDGLAARAVRDVTAETTPEDHRGRGAFRCWRIER